MQKVKSDKEGSSFSSLEVQRLNLYHFSEKHRDLSYGNPPPNLRMRIHVYMNRGSNVRSSNLVRFATYFSLKEISQHSLHHRF